MITMTFDRILVFARTREDALAWIYDTQQEWGVGQDVAQGSRLFDVFQDPGQLLVCRPQRTALIFLEAWDKGFDQDTLKQCFAYIAVLRYPYRFLWDWQPYNPLKVTVKEA